jgi:transcriptional regulator with XRE-family HTH domain
MHLAKLLTTSIREYDMHNNPENKNIGENIRLYRIRAGLTIKDLSKRIYRQYGIEIKVASIRSYEKGLEKIPAAALKNIAAIIGADIQLFYEKANSAVLLMDSARIHMLEAFCMIRRQASRDSILHLARQLGKQEGGRNE